MTNTLTISSEHKLRQENLAFDADVWYPIIAKFTFKTVFLPLRRCEATAIVHYFNARYLQRSIKQFTTYDVKILIELENRISNILNNKNNDFYKYGTFMRLCGRSAKDCEVLDRDTNLKDKYNKQLNKLTENNELDYNTKLIAIARTQYLKITNAKEAMAQLLSSERICIDLRDWILYGEPEQIVFRVWNNDVTKDYEFRVFVYNNKITAISQYDYYGVFPHLFNIKQKLKLMIYEKWKIVHPYIKQNNYIIDFAYLKSTNEMIIIEFSPFRTCTGATLFNWDKDKDLLYGNKTNNDCKNVLDAIEFRMRKKPYPNIQHLIEMNWETRYWKTKHPIPYYEWYKYAYAYTYSRKQIFINNMKKYLFDVNYQMIVVLLIGVLMGLLCMQFNYVKLLYIIEVMSVVFGMCYAYKSHCKSKKIYKRYEPPVIKHEYFEKNKNRYNLFVYGTLKKGFHWNHKYLSRSGVLINDNVITKNRYPMVIGDSGVPYLLDLDTLINRNDMKEMKYIKGEIWQIDYETLMGIDEYEGVNKGHYKRIEIEVKYRDNELNERVMKVFAWFKEQYDEDILNQPFLSEYTLEYHKKYYSPMKHIQVKQLMYLGEDFKRT
eukprot:144663_1